MSDFSSDFDHSYPRSLFPPASDITLLLISPWYQAGLSPALSFVSQFKIFALDPSKGRLVRYRQFSAVMIRKQWRP